MRLSPALTMLAGMSSSYLTAFPCSSTSRRGWLSRCAVWGASLAMVPWHAMASPDKPRLTVVLDDRTSLSHLPLLLAEHLGFFKAEGLDIEFVEQASQPIAMTALTHGAADVLCASYDTALLLKQKSVDVVSVAQIARTPQWVLGISNKNLPSFKTLADLRGKRVGIIDAEGSSQRCLWLSLLRSGVNPSQINMVTLNSPMHAMVAMRSGNLDALFATDPLMTALEKKDDIAIVANFRTLKQTQRVFSGLLPGNCLIVPQALVKQDPQTCQALVSAVVRSLKWLRTAGPSDLLRSMVDSPLLPDRLVYLNAIDNLRESFSLDGLLAPEAQQVSLRMLSLLDPTLSTSSLAWQATVRNDFVRVAKQRFRV